jgi:hypothetical protein
MKEQQGYTKLNKNDKTRVTRNYVTITKKQSYKKLSENDKTTELHEIMEP